MKAGAQVQKAAPPAAAPVASGLLQRKCACGGAPGADGECAECRKQRLQRKSASGGQTSEAPPIVHEVLRSPGQPLDEKTRNFLEPRFGHDFSRVRVHTDEKAAESVWAVHALAYTVGRDVVFGSGQYSPETRHGRRLLAHELTHVVQQSSALRSGELAVSPDADSAEREADLFASKITHMDQQAVQRQTTDKASGPNHAIDDSHEDRATESATDASGKGSRTGGCKDGHWIFDYDGCSLPRWLVYLSGIDKDDPAGSKSFDTRFATDDHTGACDRHDECYQTCNPDPGAKDKCDANFRKDMAKVCFSLPGEEEPAKKHCVRRATAYYKAVKNFGGNAFRKRQREVCACLSRA